MQEVCSTLDNTQMGAQIKSESPLNPLQVQTGQTTVVPLVAGPGGPQTQGPPPAVMLVNKMAPNCDKRAADTAYWMASEGGFINSQPSMAEFLNHLSPDSPKIGTPVGVGVGGVVGGAGSGAGGYPVGVGVGVPQTPDGMDSVPEYPWMKEKKTSRKSSNNNNQGKYLRQDEEPQSRTGNATAAANAKLALIKKSMQSERRPVVQSQSQSQPRFHLHWIPISQPSCGKSHLQCNKLRHTRNATTRLVLFLVLYLCLFFRVRLLWWNWALAWPKRPERCGKDLLFAIICNNFRRRRRFVSYDRRTDEFETSWDDSKPSSFP